MHSIRDYILRRVTHSNRPICVERSLINVAFPHPKSSGGGLAGAIMTLALADGRHRPESTQEELIESFCKQGMLSHQRDPMTGDVWFQELPKAGKVEYDSCAIPAKLLKPTASELCSTATEIHATSAAGIERKRCGCGSLMYRSHKQEAFCCCSCGAVELAKKGGE